MDLLNKLTIKNLKLNKKRTTVTIIGIVLSVALLTAVAGMFFSVRRSLINFEIREEGNYHYSFYDVPASEINTFEENRKIETIHLSKDLGYDYLESKNEYKPYAFVKAFNSSALENLSVNLIEGRLPQNENEILIPSHLKTNGGINYKIGDTITLNIGTRISEGEELKQGNPYNLTIPEVITNTEEHKYTVVGIIERPSDSIEPYSAPGYTFITYLNESNIKDNDKVDIYAIYTNAGLKEHLRVTANILGVDEEAYEELYNSRTSVSQERYEELMEKLGTPKYEFGANTYLMTLESGMFLDSTMKALATAAGVVVIIIIFTSVFCIKNSFDISISEKTKQYGMLSSIGATKKQIKKNVYYEAFILGIIGIPIGILVGTLAAYILIMISNYLLTSGLSIGLVFEFSWIAIIFAIILGAITIYLSARRSAKRASKITPITAIRNSDDIKIKAKKIKAPGYINKIFGIGGEISYKNLKRSRKKYRTTVISIMVCAAVFIPLSSFINLAFDVIKVEFKNTDYNIQVRYEPNATIEEKAKEICNLDSIKEISKIKFCNMYIKNDKYTDEYLEIYPEDNTLHMIDEDGNEIETGASIQIYSVDNEAFERYVKKLGLIYDNVKDKGILINNIYDSKYVDGKIVTVEIPQYKFKVGETISGYVDAYDDEENYYKQDFSIQIANITTTIPMGVTKYSSTASLIISEDIGNKINDNTRLQNIFIDSKDSNKTQEEIEEILKDTEYNIYNLDENVKTVKSLYTLVAIFLYGFITVIALIGVTNIFNTITTNMKLRSREFAMLKSIGMTKKEFNRMIRLESFFYGTKSLIIGIPVGIGLSYLLYKLLTNGSLIIKYKLPISACLISIFAVFILITVIMKYSIKKINKQNTIETIRNDNI